MTAHKHNYEMLIVLGKYNTFYLWEIPHTHDHPIAITFIIKRFLIKNADYNVAHKIYTHLLEYERDSYISDCKTKDYHTYI